MSAVIITLPHEIARGTQVCVVSDEEIKEPAILVRAASHHAWVPISHIDGTWEVRP